jgi:hypothetical protein
VTQYGCGPRPNVGVSTAKIGPGQLQATLTAQTNGSTPLNNLLSVRIISIANAAVQLNGSSVSVGQTITFPADTTQATLLLTRQAAGQASTVAFVVSDLCGEWKSFVGGGPGAF